MLKKKIISNVILLVLGNFILACAVVFLFIPNDILSGGVAGVAIALAPLLPFSVQTIMTGVIVITFLMGLAFLGKSFALKTLASSILYPTMTSLLSQIPFGISVEPILASIFGGILAGIGLGLVFRTGASTGGMDIPPLILAKKTNIKVTVWIMIIDFLTILLGLSTYGLNSVLNGVLSIWGTSKAIDFISTLGGEGAKQVFIISENYDQLLTMILRDIDRGATLINAEGGFTRNKKQIILTVIMKQQYTALERSVKELDEDAFLIVSDATEVHGNGFYKV